MANLTSSSIVDGSTIEASHITALYDVFTGAATYDNISLSGTSSYALTASYAENAGGSDTGSLLTTASVSDNTITFTKGDASTFNITVDTGSGGGSTDTGSLLTTASVSSNTITFTKGDASTFNITVNGGTADALAANGELRGLTTASGHIIPNGNDLYDLGTAEKKFRDLYLGSSTLYMSGSGGWMSGSWDGTNFKVNNNALVRSAVTSSMSVLNANQTFGTYNNTFDLANPLVAPLKFAAGGAVLQGGQIAIDAFAGELGGSVLGDSAWITVTAINGGGSTGVFDVTLTQGRVTITEIGGTSNAGIMYQVIYL